MKELIEKYRKQIEGYQKLIYDYENRGIENLDGEEIEYYGAYLGKVEILENVIEDLLKLQQK